MDDGWWLVIYCENNVIFTKKKKSLKYWLADILTNIIASTATKIQHVDRNFTDFQQFFNSCVAQGRKRGTMVKSLVENTTTAAGQ